MYTIVDLCLLCLKRWKILENILVEDCNGVRIEEKLKYLCELDSMGSEISKQICLHCLESLNYSYEFKQQCIRNVVKFNSYIHTLNTSEEPCANLKVHVIDIKNVKLNQEIATDDSSSEDIKLENLSTIAEPCSNLEEQLIDIKNPKLNQKIALELEHLSSTEEPCKNLELNQEIAIDDSSSEDIKLENLSSIEEPCSNLEEQLIDIKNPELNQEIAIELENLSSTEEPCKNLELNQEIAINDSNSEAERSENFNLENVITLKIEKEEHIIVNDEVAYEIINEIVKEESEDINNEIDINPNVEEEPIDELQKDTTENQNTENLSTRNTNPKKSGTKKYKCNECDKVFTLSNSLYNHKRRMHNNEPFLECNVCGQKCRFKPELRRHKLIHTVKSLKCDFCYKLFSQKSRLEKHKLKHLTKEPIKCEICGKIFIYPILLKRHMGLHTGDKPLKCEYCGKGFITMCHLKRHLRIHTEKAHKCDLCDNAYYTNEKLLKHKKSKHKGTKPT